MCWVCVLGFLGVFYSVLVEHIGVAKIPDLVGSKTCDVVVFLLVVFLFW
jgi:hypothetical protein